MPISSATAISSVRTRSKLRNKVYIATKRAAIKQRVFVYMFAIPYGILLQQRIGKSLQLGGLLRT